MSTADTQRSVEPGARVTLTPDGMGPLGECTGTLDGIPVTVFGGIPGERVEAEVVRRYRDHTALRVVGVPEPSAHRTAPPCPFFWPCTGCQWQHISYDHQLELKQRAVQDALGGAPGLDGVRVLPTLPSPQQYGYRNHARFTIGPEGALGFVNRITRRFVRVGLCGIMAPWINETLGKLQGRCAETTQLSIRHGVNTGDGLIQPKLVGVGTELETGQKHYEEQLGGRRFRIASPSFFQVNTPGAEAMFEYMVSRLQLTGRELVVDAYAGVGTFAALLASRAGRVVAVEESSAAVRDAEANVEDLGNVEMRRGRTEDVLSSLEERPDVVVLDPPRAGCHPRAIEALKRLRPMRVAYVSCDPEALARDLSLLVQGGFRVDEVQPVDLFPHTHHVECIAMLSPDVDEAAGAGKPGSARTAGAAVLVLASASPRRRQLLGELGLAVELTESGVDETTARADQAPEALATELALRKASAVASRRGDGLVIGADTVVALDGRVLGKPATESEARQMLTSLRGRRHRVITGVAVVDGASGRAEVEHRTSVVEMREYTDAEIEAFVASGEAMDKAGAYAVQDPVFRPARAVEGCFANVIGLPLCALAGLLGRSGAEVLPREGWTPPGPCAECAALARQART